MIATDQISVLLAVVQGKSKHALQIIQKLWAFFLIQREDNFAVGTGLELIAIAVLSAQRLVVINFTVNRQDMRFLHVVQRLSTGVDVDDGQTFVCQNGVITGVNTRPVRAAMAHQTRQFQGFFTQFNCVSFNIEYAKNRTHNLLR